MSAETAKKQEKKRTGKSALAKWVLALVVIAIAVGGSVVFRWMAGNPDKPGKTSGIFAVQRRDLPITVIESGDIKAINSKDIKSEVRRRTKIISIVEEGTYITSQDVNNGKILVELDSSEIEQDLAQQEIRFLSAKANLTDAEESLDIQKKQNESDIQGGKMKVRFALMDMQKYLAEVVSDKLMSSTANPGIEPNKVARLVYDPNLGGEALQKLREYDSDIKLKGQDLELAKSKLIWTERLYEKKYVSLNDKQADNLDKERKEIALEKAKTAKHLFVKYEFPKQSEKLMSEYNEAKRELERIEARARSKLAQAQARLDSNRAQYLVQEKQLEKLQKELKSCIIKAPSPGQVVYSSSGDPWARQRGRIIEVGADVYERQKIISIPDTSEMKVEIKIHENWVDKIQLGQTANITIGAFPEDKFTGKVIKKSPLADQTRWWSNPDLKAYATDVSIDGTHEFLKTGMSAKVEVIINQLKDVICVPIQTVVNREGKKVCFVKTDNGPQIRQVATGEFNNDFVEIKSGLSEGEKVLLNPPRISEAETAGKKR